LQARDAQQEAEERRDRAEAAFRSNQTKRAELSGRIGTSTNADISERLAELRAQVSQAHSTDVPALHAELEKLHQLQTTIAADEKQAREQLTAAQSALGALDVAEQAKRREIAEVAGEHGSATQALAVAETQLAALDQALAALEKQSAASAGLSDEEILVDPDDAAARGRQAIAAYEQAVQRAEQTADRAAILANAVTALEQLATEFTAALDGRASIASAAEVPVMVADIATARSPANRRKMPLASYAVQLRFAHVLESASLHLERMSAGQYAFQLSEAFRGREQAGLGIEVVDSWTGQARDPRSLSGGETFYAALALALGLADVVHSETGGAQLETLFVDEGFGSLDQDTLQLVLDQLDQLRSGGRVVGVISHVTEMKERIPDRIQVHVLPDHTSAISQIPHVSV
jgi:exonuclease SbcC